MYESIHHNDALALLPGTRRKNIRPAMELVILTGVDSSLVSLSTKQFGEIFLLTLGRGGCDWDYHVRMYVRTGIK